MDESDQEDHDIVNDDDQLPFGLDPQLGQLVINAGQYLNPNIMANELFAGYVGGDEDFGMNPGDDWALIDSMSDTDSILEEDSVKEIFVSLSDSHVVKRLSFHKEVEPMFRLPRVTPAHYPSYEELFRLLEELELLIKVWKRRLEHPYTAHISGPEETAMNGDSGSPAGGGDALREGEDYNSEDYEYDSEDGEQVHYGHTVGVNENLSKKKYCKSVKVLNQLFETTRKFDIFHKNILKMKKNVFAIIFNLFLEALPTETRLKMPQELWEKVWKFSQNSYFRNKSNESLHTDTTYFKCGLRSSKSGMVLLEKERIRDLYGAVGNLHMIVFEILFKNPVLLKPSPEFELEFGFEDNASEKLSKSLWLSSCQNMRTKFSRFQQLESILENSCPAADAEIKSRDLELSLDTGRTFVEDVNLSSINSEIVDHIDVSASVLVSHRICSKFLLTGRYILDNEDYGLLLIVTSAVTGETEEVILTGLSYQTHLLEVGRCGLRRIKDVEWKSHYCLTESRLSFIALGPNNSRDLHTYELSSRFQLGGDPVITQPKKPLVSGVFEHADPVPCIVRHTNSSVVVLTVLEHLSTLEVFSLETGEVVLSLTWQEKLSFCGISDTRILLQNNAKASFIFLSLQAGEVIETIPQNTLNADFKLTVDGKWSGMMDVDPDNCPQFLLYSSTLSAYRLYRFHPAVEMSKPVPILSGSIAEGIEGLGNNSILFNSNLLTNKASFVSSYPLVSDVLQCHEVSSFGLDMRSKHTLLLMPTSISQPLEPFLNLASLRYCDPPTGDTFGGGGLWNPSKRPLMMVSRHLVGFLTEDRSILRGIHWGDQHHVIAAKEVKLLAQRDCQMDEE